MTDTMLILPDSHAHPDHPNDRAIWLGRLMVDLKPDVVINGGDQFDMSSLSSYDKGKRSFHGKSYQKDIEAGLDFHEKMWEPVFRQKKRLPYRVFLVGNHEQRVDRALDMSPELEGTIGYKNYDLGTYYDTVVHYDGQLPGIFEYEGILFAHFFPTGVSGRPISGENPAKMLMYKNKCSSIAFHTHILDFASQKTVKGQVFNTVVAGCYQDYESDWAGPVAQFWRSGVVVLRNVEKGNFDFQWISLESLKKEYQ